MKSVKIITKSIKIALDAESLVGVHTHTHTHTQVV